LAESRDAHVKIFDVPGAVLVTGGLVTLVFAITQASDYGWTSPATLGLFAAAGVLLASFVAWESRAKEPLMPFSIFRIRTVSAANLAGLVLGTVTFSMFLMLTLYMQQVLGYSPLKTGVAYLAVAGTAIVWSTVAAQVVNRVGVKPTIATGMTLLTVGLLYFTQISVGGSYVSDLLPGFLIIGAGLGFSFVPISIAALAGVASSEAGLASGLFNTSQQIGGALGIAALSTIATSTTSDEVATGTALPYALTDGFESAFIWGAVVAALGILVALVLVRRSDLEAVEEVPEPAFEAAA
jgi:predicted MFS family arabinose efflux permease